MSFFLSQSDLVFTFPKDVFSAVTVLGIYSLLPWPSEVVSQWKSNAGLTISHSPYVPLAPDQASSQNSCATLPFPFSDGKLPGGVMPLASWAAAHLTWTEDPTSRQHNANRVFESSRNHMMDPSCWLNHADLIIKVKVESFFIKLLLAANSQELKCWFLCSCAVSVLSAVRMMAHFTRFPLC